jgi:hypothetical protein
LPAPAAAPTLPAPVGASPLSSVAHHTMRSRACTFPQKRFVLVLGQVLLRADDVSVG